MDKATENNKIDAKPGIYSGLKTSDDSLTTEQDSPVADNKSIESIFNLFLIPAIFCLFKIFIC